jgi:acetyltransferase-like isoleucine patch superfamily enzyme
MKGRWYMNIFILIILVVLIIKNILLAIYSRKKEKKWQLHERQENVIGGNPVLEDAQKESDVRKIVRNYVSSFIHVNLKLIGGIPSQRLRKWLLKNIYRMKIGENVIIYGGFEIREPWNITIGDGTIIGDESKLDGRNGLYIGKNVNLSTGVWIWTEQHDYNDPLFRTLNKGGKVIIDDRAWISCRTIVLPGTHIGEGAVIAAGGVVAKDCLPYKVYGGCPVKVIAERNQNLQYEFSGSYVHFL